MNKIVFRGRTFDDNNDDDTIKRHGYIINGDYNLNTSLIAEELPVDTLRADIRYTSNYVSNKGDDLSDTDYGANVYYYQNDKLYRKFYMESIDRTSKYGYTINCISEIGLLKAETDYGGVYDYQQVKTIIDNMLKPFATKYHIDYVIDDVYQNKYIDGWLPIAPVSENLKQILFATRGEITHDGEKLVFTTAKPKTGKIIGENEVYQGGKTIANAAISEVEITEHQYLKSFNPQPKVIYEGATRATTVIRPGTTDTYYGALITFPAPYYDIKAENATIVQSGANYCLINPTGGKVKITGVPYEDNTNTIFVSSKINTSGKKAFIKDATLVTPRNSNTVGERTLRLHETNKILETSVVQNGIELKDNVVLKDNFDEIKNGYIQSIQGTMSKNIVKSDIEVAVGYAPYNEDPDAINKITIARPPDKTVYATGEYFDPTGTVLRAYRVSGGSKYVSGYVRYPNRPLKDTDTYVIFEYENNFATQPITVKVLPLRMDVIKSPIKTTYNIGDTVDLTGLDLQVVYSDGYIKKLTDNDYTYTPKEPLTGQEGQIVITYVDGETTLTAKIDIFYNGSTEKLVSIAVTNPPLVTNYQEGDIFDPTGMVVTGTFEGGITREITNYTWSPSGPLEKGQEDITITVNWSNGTFTTIYKISNYYLQSLAIVRKPYKLVYYEGEEMNNTGLLLQAHYSNGDVKDVPDGAYTWRIGFLDGQRPLQYTDLSINYLYQERGQHAYVSLDIVVDYYPYEYDKYAIITGDVTDTLQNLLPGVTHRNIRVNYLGLPKYASKPVINRSYGGDDGVGITITDANGAGVFQAEQPNIQPAWYSSNATKGDLGGPITSKDVVIPYDYTSIYIKMDKRESDETPQRKASFYATTAEEGKSVKLDFTSNQEQSDGFINTFDKKLYATKGKDGEFNGGKGGLAGQPGESSGIYKGGKPGVAEKLEPIVLTHTDKFEPVLEETYTSDAISAGGFVVYKSAHNGDVVGEKTVEEMKAMFPRREIASGYSSVTVDPKTGIITGHGSASFGVQGDGEGYQSTIRQGWAKSIYNADYYTNKDGNVSTDYNVRNAFTLYNNIQNTEVPQYGVSYTSYDEVVAIVYFEEWDPSAAFPIHYHTLNITTYRHTIKRVAAEDKVYEVTISCEYVGGGGGGAGYIEDGHDAIGINGGDGSGKTTAPIKANYGSGCAGGGGAGAGGTGGYPVVTVTENIPGAIDKVKPYSYTFNGGKGGKGVSSDLEHLGGKDAYIIYYS